MTKTFCGWRDTIWGMNKRPERLRCKASLGKAMLTVWGRVPMEDWQKRHYRSDPIIKEVLRKKPKKVRKGWNWPWATVWGGGRKSHGQKHARQKRSFVTVATIWGWFAIWDGRLCATFPGQSRPRRHRGDVMEEKEWGEAKRQLMTGKAPWLIDKNSTQGGLFSFGKREWQYNEEPPLLAFDFIEGEIVEGNSRRTT